MSDRWFQLPAAVSDGLTASIPRDWHNAIAPCSRRSLCESLGDHLVEITITAEDFKDILGESHSRDYVNEEKVQLLSNVNSYLLLKKYVCKLLYIMQWNTSLLRPRTFRQKSALYLHLEKLKGRFLLGCWKQRKGKLYILRYYFHILKLKLANKCYKYTYTST